MSIGENIKKVRKEKKMTQKSLGELCEPPISASTIRKYELNILNPKIGTLHKIAKALDIPLWVLTTENTHDFLIKHPREFVNELLENTPLNELIDLLEELYFNNDYELPLIRVYTKYDIAGCFEQIINDLGYDTRLLKEQGTIEDMDERKTYTISSTEYKKLLDSCMNSLKWDVRRILNELEDAKRPPSDEAPDGQDQNNVDN